MTRSVLCAIDINRPEAELPVLRAAARMAALDEARLDVLTVLPDFGAPIVGLYLQDHHVATAKDRAEEVLSDVVRAALGEDGDAEVRHIVATGSVYQEVLKTAKLAGSDLIVVGAHAPDLRDFLIGPNAARIVSHSECSVFVVRDGST